MEQMKAVSIHLPDEVLDAIDELVKAHIFSSRSEAVRYMVIQWITQNMPFALDLGVLDIHHEARPGERRAQFISLWVPIGIGRALEQLRQKLGAISRSEICRQALLTYILMLAKKER